jgi:hypothetical protein
MLATMRRLLTDQPRVPTTEPREGGAGAVGASTKRSCSELWQCSAIFAWMARKGGFRGKRGSEERNGLGVGTSAYTEGAWRRREWEEHGKPERVPNGHPIVGPNGVADCAVAHLNVKMSIPKKSP